MMRTATDTHAPAEAFFTLRHSSGDAYSHQPVSTRAPVRVHEVLIQLARVLSALVTALLVISLNSMRLT